MQRQQFVRVVEVARALGVSPVTVRNWTKQGRIPALRIGSQTARYDLEEVIEAVRQPVKPTGESEK